MSFVGSRKTENLFANGKMNSLCLEPELRNELLAKEHWNIILNTFKIKKKKTSEVG